MFSPPTAVACVAATIILASACSPDSRGDGDLMSPQATDSSLLALDDEIGGVCSQLSVALIAEDDASLYSWSQTAASNYNSAVRGGVPQWDWSQLRTVTAYSSETSVPGGSQKVFVERGSATGSDGWCGAHYGVGPYDGIGISECDQPEPFSTTDQYATQDPVTVILHELFNVWGHSNIDAPDGSPTDECVLDMPNTPGQPHATTPCLHEIQLEYFSCGLKPSAVDLESHLITGVTAIGPTSLVVDGDPGQFEATFSASGGAPSAGVRWSVGDPGVLNLSSTIANPTTVSGESVGQSWVNVRVPDGPNVVYPEPSNSILVEVEAPPLPPVASIELSPTSVLVGQPPATTVTATAYDSSGNPLSEVPFDWSIRHPSIAYLGMETDDSVQVWPNQNGTTTLTARVGTVAGTAAVEVDCGPFACF